jgi:hypothetical protein
MLRPEGKNHQSPESRSKALVTRCGCRRLSSPGMTWSRIMPTDATACRWLASNPGGKPGPKVLSDDDLVLGYDLHGAVFGDVEDAAAHTLPVRQVDEDLIAWPPSRFRLIHDNPACAARLVVSRTPSRARVQLRHHTLSRSAERRPAATVCSSSCGAALTRRALEVRERKLRLGLRLTKIS